MGQTLSQSYGRFFAEFLEDDSLVPLRLLASPTCVGLGTVPISLSLEAFLGGLLTRLRTSVLRLDAWAILERIYQLKTLTQRTPNH